MKARLAQHTIDCSGQADAAREAWKTQGIGWLALPGETWRALPGDSGGGAWAWASARWGAELRVLHLVEPGDHGTRVHARVEVEGPLAWLHRILLQGDYRSRLPGALRAVARGLASAPVA
ncbi:MAG: hypothetical protein U0P81_14480 [Holophagaceae bacterium]